VKYKKRDTKRTLWKIERFEYFLGIDKARTHISKRQKYWIYDNWLLSSIISDL